jgi:hypothetical protein
MSYLDRAPASFVRRGLYAGAACVALAVTASLTIACTTTPSSAPDGGPPPATTSDAGTCPALDTGTSANGPTVHEGEVRGTEIWTASGSPHLVRGDVNIRDGAKLVIEPCARVELADGASLNVAFPLVPNQGELVAEGTPDRPIRFEGKDGARYNHLFVHAPGTARLAWVTFSGGGHGESRGHETIGASGDGSLPRKEMLFVDHVTVEASGGAGVRLDVGAAFAPGSTDLVVTGSGKNDVDHPYPLEVGESAVPTIPTGVYTGNGKDEILLDPETVASGGGFQVDTTMRSYGVPWHVGRAGDQDALQIGNNNRDAVLTIEAGTKILFEKGSVLQIEADDDGGSAIRALGTADRPVVFSSAAASPAPGDWRGLYFNGTVSAQNSLQHVRIEYTGADCHCSMVTCSEGVGTYEAAIIFSRPPSTMFLEHSVLAHGSGHGVVAGYDGATFDWKQTNTFEDIALCPVTLPRDVDTSCPDPLPACK